MQSIKQPNNWIDETNVDDFCQTLLEKMTLEEKVGQMVQVDLFWKEDIPTFLKQGRIGSLLTIKDVAKINSLQRIAVEESRLGIPLLVGNDAIHGYRTIFPIPLALACTWEPGLISDIAGVIRKEAVASGTSWTFAPMVDICRDPRWGRIAEGAGEDPYLGSIMAKAWVTGFQSTSGIHEKSLAACVKHFAAYGGAEAGRDYNSVDMSELRLRQVYLPPYQAAIQAGVLTIMTSFNELNGIPATANRFLLQDILRGEWGFEGVIISDYNSIGELVLHGYAENLKEAAYLSINAGVDIDMMSNAYHIHLADLVNEGRVNIHQIDASVLRILKLKGRLGLFEQPYVDELAVAGELLQQSSRDLALRAAEKSAVLLQNKDQLLPLQPSGKTIALIGPLAEKRQSLMGSWTFDGRPEETETLLEGFTRCLGNQAKLVHVLGCDVEGKINEIEKAIAVASQADIILLALGETDGMSGEAHSRAHLGLPGHQQTLVDAVAALGKPVVALLFTGRPLVLTNLVQKVGAIILFWQCGTFTSPAVANIVLGNTNPSGKLTASFPRSEGQIPVYHAHKSTGRPIVSQGTLQFDQAHTSSYLDEKNDPLFPFGFGLSYTSFSYQNLVVETPVLLAADTLIVSATVTNVGDRDGTEIVQCYIRDLFGSVTRPVKELKGFQKVYLKIGESTTVRFKIPASELSFIGPAMNPMIESGDFKVWIGPDSQSGLEGSFLLKLEH